MDRAEKVTATSARDTVRNPSQETAGLELIQRGENSRQEQK